MILEINGHEVEVDEQFVALSPEDQERTVEEIASSLPASKASGVENFMGGVNKGIAEGVGGLVDFVNPFSEQTGSAAEGLVAGMKAAGIAVDEGEPDGMAGALARGIGQGAAAMVPATGGLKALQGAAGATGAIARRLFPQSATVAGAGTEMAAAGVGKAAGAGAEQQGAPEWVQQSAEILGPAVALPAAGAALRGAGAVAGKAPGISVARRVGRDVKRGLIPMTREGAEEVAAERLRGLVGGEQRAADLGRTISKDDDLGLTPAQQTGDPNLLGLERQAAREDPVLRERLSERADASRKKATENIDAIGGDVADATSFFNERISESRKGLEARASRAVARAGGRLDAAGPKRPETETSARVVAALKQSLDNELAAEADLWGAVPRDAIVGTGNAKEAARAAVDKIPYAQRDDIPKTVREILEVEDVFGSEATVREMHGAYSKLREVARSAMAGTNQQKNLARIANTVADAILKDLGARDGATEVGRKINAARAFSRALHETFDQGTVGKILNRTVDGDETIAPGVALARTVGTGGAAAQVASRDITTAAAQGADGVTDFLRSKFVDAVRNASGEFTPKKAREWLRNNREVLADHPALRDEIGAALGSRQKAEMFATRAAARAKLLDKSAAAQFGSGSGKAVLSIVASDNPATTARAVVASARKDKSGKAMAGVKAAFSDLLIAQSAKDGVISPKALSAMLSDGKMRSALQQVFSSDELGRIQRIASQLAKIEGKSQDVGEVINSPANKLIEMVVRIAAAKHGGNLGGGSMGGSIQTANIFTERARAMLRNLTNDRARALLIEAIEDPELFRSLLKTPQSVAASKADTSRLGPYLMGAGAVAVADDETNNPAR